MKILVIDRDEIFSGLLASKARAAGHEVFETRIKHDGIEQIESRRIDAVYFDPSPLMDPKAIIFQIKRQIHSFPYLVLTGAGGERMAAIKSGCNDALSKPLDPEALNASLENAARMTDIIGKLGDESFDFPSSGGVISKSAFNQLFLSALDRAGRYEESAHAIFFSIANYEDIKLDDGKYAADYAVSMLARTLARLRRQSDILAQTDKHEFALLLQRQQASTESFDAARRFAVSLADREEISSNGTTSILIDVSLVNIPTGVQGFHHRSVITPFAARRSG